jgi:ATP-dependent helicase HrpB
MKKEATSLPIYPYLDGLASKLLSSPSRFLVLTAETAAGKSTLAPIAFLPRVQGKIVMLEPRRVATVAIAERIADLLGERVGETAGYRVRLDSKVGPRTKIEVITEAILTRRLQSDPSLNGVSVVILDEFHERSVHTDLALALLKEVAALRDNLFVLVMSATIDAGKLCAYLSAPLMRVPGRRFPVEIEYATDIAAKQGLGIAEKTARAVERCIASCDGDVLAFLPGIYELTRAKDLLSGLDAEFSILHSSIPLSEQRRILSAPDDASGNSRRRVILSTSIAETSLTVPGVSVVVDSGVSRVLRFDVGTGMDRLVTETESDFQATQRAGRAGRTGPGRCVRLWAPSDARVAETPPEIARSDILPLCLECALWGVREISGLEWLDPPNGPAWVRARELLAEMGALDRSGAVTERGRKIASLGVHPRIAAVALAGGIDLAASHSNPSASPREIALLRDDLARRVGGKTDGVVGVMSLLAGFPDRLARHAGEGTYRFPSGRIASLPREAKALIARPPEWIVATDVDSGEREGRIRAFEALSRAETEAWLDGRLVDIVDLSFPGGDYKPGVRPIKTVSRSYGKIAISSSREEPSADEIGLAVLGAIRRGGIDSLPWSKSSRDFLARARFARRLSRSDDSSDEALLSSIEAWLAPFLSNDGSLGESAFLDALRYRFDGALVDRMAPARISLPNGLSRILAYEELVSGEGPIPILEIKIQELFGCPDTPRVSGIPVLLRLLSPARRPIQITSDLSGFWERTWSEVRKELKGRYPKHKWPEDPFVPPTDNRR